jgi:hypothetical protein
MGCHNTKPSPDQKVQSKSEVPQTHITPEFDPNAKPVDNKQDPAQGINHTSSLRIVVQDDPPAYNHPAATGDETQPDSVKAILNILRDADAMRDFGIKGAFSGLRQRHSHVWIDSNYIHLPNTKNAIQVQALFLLLIAKAQDLDMTFFFTSYPNKKSKDLSDEAKKRLDVLSELWETQSLQQAVALVERTPKLQQLGIRDWIDNPANYNAEDTDPEKHTKLLIHVREKMLPYWYGWHQRDITMERLPKLQNSAILAASKQPKALNAVRFTYEREVKRYLRLIEQDQAYPLTAIFLLASAMQPTEITAIQKCQESGRQIKRTGGRKQSKRLLSREAKEHKEEDDEAEGKGTQFCIAAGVMVENMDATAIEGYKKIDTFATGEDDINDMTEIQESKVLDFFLSALCLFKMLNSHHPSVDNMPMAASEQYGSLRLTPNGNVITMPRVSDVKKIFGIEDLSNLVLDDEDNDAKLVYRTTLLTTIDASNGIARDENTAANGTKNLIDDGNVNTFGSDWEV